MKSARLVEHIRTVTSRHSHDEGLHRPVWWDTVACVLLKEIIGARESKR